MPTHARAPTPVTDMETVALAARSTVERLGPRLRIETRWGNPWYVGNDLVVLIGPFRAHVGAEFWRGASLAAAHPILEGTGKNLRHVKLRTPEEARSRAFQSLVRDALRLDRSEPRRVR